MLQLLNGIILNCEIVLQLVDVSHLLGIQLLQLQVLRLKDIRLRHAKRILLVLLLEQCDLHQQVIVLNLEIPILCQHFCQLRFRDLRYFQLLLELQNMLFLFSNNIQLLL